MNCDKTCRDTYVCEGKKGSFCKMEIGKSENPIYNYIPFFFKFNRQIITANIQKNFAKRLEFFLYFIHKNAYDEWKRLSRKEREFAERNIDGFDLEKLKNVPEEPELSIEDHRSDPWVKFTKKLKQEERNVELNRVFGFMPSRSISSSEEGESEPTGGPEDSVDKVDSEVRSEPESTVLFERGLAQNTISAMRPDIAFSQGLVMSEHELRHRQLQAAIAAHDVQASRNPIGITGSILGMSRGDKK